MLSFLNIVLCVLLTGVASEDGTLFNNFLQYGTEEKEYHAEFTECCFVCSCFRCSIFGCEACTRQ